MNSINKTDMFFLTEQNKRLIIKKNLANMLIADFLFCFCMCHVWVDKAGVIIFQKRAHMKIMLFGETENYCIRC